MMYGPLAAYFSEMPGAKLRYSGAPLGYQLGALLGGAVAPLVSIYIIVVSVIAVGCTSALTETYQNEMEDAQMRA